MPVTTTMASSVADVVRRCRLVSLATTALEPHIHDVSGCAPGAVFLHVSLRDIAPEVIVACDNVVDDADHACRAQTSVHLAEQRTGSRAFIRCHLAALLDGTAPAKRDAALPTVFSPFGLGVLDLAVGTLLFDLARASGRGTLIPDFFTAADDLAAPATPADRRHAAIVG
jgi:ornithine cyclodeaminase